MCASVQVSWVSVYAVEDVCGHVCVLRCEVRVLYVCICVCVFVCVCVCVCVCCALCAFVCVPVPVSMYLRLVLAALRVFNNNIHLVPARRQ